MSETWEYGFYDSQHPGAIYWSTFGGLVGFDTAESARRTASKSVTGTAIIVRRRPGETEWEHAADHDASTIQILVRDDTPTDDEQRATSTSEIAAIIDRAIRPWGVSNIGTHSAARAIIAAGFRRTEVSTPPRTGSRPEATPADSTPDRGTAGVEVPEPSGAIYDAFGTVVTRADTAFELGRQAGRSEPQGEPSDAQADAAQRGYHAFTFGPDEVDSFLTPERLATGREAWKAALRSAGGVR